MQKIFEEFKYNKVIGDIGHPIFPSTLSVIHNSAFRLMGLNYIYVPFDVPFQNIEMALRAILSLGIAGINITYPHSEKVMTYLDEVTGEASMVGSVNTIVNDGDRLIGYNTNINGIFDTLKPFKEELQDQQFTIFGAGNIAKVLIYTLVKNFKPKLILIVNRNQQKTEQLRKYVREELNYSEIKLVPFIYEDILSRSIKSRVMINTTPLGMVPKIDECIIDTDAIFNENQIVIDLIFNPTETKFMRMAINKKARVVSGINILLYQAAKAFEFWTNKSMPVEEVKKILFEIRNT
jgi:shikimate dehydrogenase